jgi:hypothetical protein
MKSVCMIPMADNVNHSNVRVTHELVNLEKHLQQPNPEYFTVSRYSFDYRDIAKAYKL